MAGALYAVLSCLRHERYLSGMDLAIFGQVARRVDALPELEAHDHENRDRDDLPTRARVRLRVETVSDYRAERVRATVLRGEAMATSLYRGNWTYFPSLLWRTDAVRAVGFREGLDVVLDLALLVDLAFAGEALAYDPRVLFRYRRHDASVSSVQAVDGRRFAEENARLMGQQSQ